MRVAEVGVEQPPAAHVHLGAVGGHDVQVWGALGAGDEPGGNRRARKELGDKAPEQVLHSSVPVTRKVTFRDATSGGYCGAGGECVV